MGKFFHLLPSVKSVKSGTQFLEKPPPVKSLKSATLLVAQLAAN